MTTSTGAADVLVLGQAQVSLGWRIVKNSAAQVVGRVCISTARLVLASLIIRNAGTGVFGQYSLVLGMVALADWVVDFGTTDVFVRDISRDPGARARLLRILTATKLLQVPAAFLALAAMLVLLGYPSEVIGAGVVGGASLLFLGVVTVYRVIFRASLTMERDVAAELASVVATIPIVALVLTAGGGVAALAGCHVVSRAVYCGAAFVFGREQFRPSLAGVSWADVKTTMRASAAIGMVGFLVGGYETLDILVLSKFAIFTDVAFYSGAQRLVWPVLMAAGAIAATFYPVIASYWPHSREAFESTCQRGVDAVFAVAGLALCSALAGAEFYMGLLGPDLVAGATALRVLAVLCLVKVISSSIGPVLYVVHAQREALKFIAAALVAKALVMGAVAPVYGYIGVAYGALSVELCVSAAAVVLIRRHAGFRLQWNVIARIAFATAAASAGARLLAAGPAAAFVAPLLYLAVAFTIGAIRPTAIRSVLAWR